MQADRRLVQDIGDADQPGADLRGKPDALRLAARQRRGAARKRKIVQPHVVEKRDAGADLLKNLRADPKLLACQAGIHLRHHLLQVSDRERRHLIDVPAVDGHRQRALLQPLAATGLAGRDAHEGLIHRLHGLAEGLTVPALHIPDQPLERHIVGALAPLAAVTHLDLAALCPIDQDIMNLSRIVAKRRIHAEMVLPGQRIQQRPRK